MGEASGEDVPDERDVAIHVSVQEPGPYIRDYLATIKLLLSAPFP